LSLDSGIFAFDYGIFSRAVRRAYLAEFNQLEMTMDLCLDLCRATDRFRIGMLWWRDLVGLQLGSVIVQRAAKRLHAGKTTELTWLRDARVCLVRANLLLAGQGEQHRGRSRR
jgi:hypothetical protein